MTEPDQQPDTVFGTWWLPSTPDHKVGGEMKMGAYGERRLQLSGSIHLPPPGEKLPFGPHEEPIIHGVSPQNRRYSLIAAQRRQTGFDPETRDSISETWEFKYYASSRRHHIEPTTEVERIQVFLSTLSVWCFDQDGLFGMMGAGGAVTPPEPLMYTATVQKATITFCDTWDTSMVPSLFSIRHAPSLGIEVNTTIENVHTDWVWPLQQLFCFLTSEYAPVAKLQVQTPDHDEWVDLVPDIVAPVDPSKQPELMRMFASKAALDHYDIDLSTLIKNWMLLANEQPYLLEIINILGVRRYFYDDALLVFLFRTLELYSASNLEGERFSETEYERRVERILDGTPTDLKSWLRNILEYQNRKSQRTKLKELLKRCHRVGDKIVDKFPDFVHHTVEQRNRTVHGRQPDATDEAQSRKVCWYLEWMTYCLILAELDIPHETADQIVINNWRSPFR